MSFVYPAINRCAEEPAWSLCPGMFLQFVEPINGSSFRSSTTLSSYMLLYKVSIVCTWGYARDDRRKVAPADNKSLSCLNITDRGTSGPLVRRQALPGYV